MPSAGSNEIYPLSLVQEEIWLSQVTLESIPLYNIGGYLRINGPMAPDLFIQAHRQVTRENDAFRMTLQKGRTIPGISVLDRAEELTLMDFSKHGAPDQTAMAWWNKEFCRPFQLYDRLMSRYYLLKVSDTQYYYAVCRHHLTMDGFSFSILGKRLAETYNALVQGSYQLDIKPSYIDFILNDQEYRNSNAFYQSKDYWKEKYATLPLSIIPRRYVSEFNSRAIPSAFSHIWLKRKFYNTLIDFTKQRQANVFFLMVAVLYTYFMRTTHVQEFVFSLPLLNRATPEFKATLGPFVNVNPIRLSFGLDIDIETFFSLIRDELFEGLPHQRFPLGEINRVSGIQKTGRGQIFDIGLSYERFDYNTHFNGTPFEVNTMHNGYDQTPLTLAIKEYQKDQDVKLEFYYNLSAFKPNEIDFLMARVQHLLEQILDHPEKPLADLSILPNAERKKLLIEFNQDGVSHTSSEPCVCSRFDRAARAHHSKEAIRFGTRSITYGQLNDRAARLGACVQSLLPAPRALVGVFTHRSVETIIAILSILKAGGSYLPLDPEYPEERIRFMLKDSGTSIILTQKQLVCRLPEEEGQKVVVLDDVSCDSRESLNSADQISPNMPASLPDTLAYVIYTSGTTGQPKGVMCTHGGLANLVTAQNRIFGINNASQVLQFASLSFDASVSEIFTTLTAGATLVMADKNELMPGQALLDTLEKQRITHVTLPPSALAVMENKPLPDLETLITAGEACPSWIFEKWGKSRRFINAYGPTENTVCASMHICTQTPTGNLPLGKPIDNTSLYVLDEQFEPVPLGVPGQLYIGGVGLARGYLNRPDLDREKFIKNPLNHIDGYDRLYRTGDVVRFLTESTMAFMGRTDNQVKVRGYRIELQEVESVLSRHPDVSDVAVVLRHGIESTDPNAPSPSMERGLGGEVNGEVATGNKFLAAFFSSGDRAGDERLSAELRQYAKQKLPPYMMPTYFIWKDRLPHTLNGKIDRRRLETDDILKRPTLPSREPATDTEKKLMLIFCSVTHGIGLSIGQHDDFFETGMDSLTAVKFMSRIDKEFNHLLSFSDLMNNSTIHTLAKHLFSRQGGVPAHSQTLVAMNSSGENPPFFCVTAGFGDGVALKQLSNHLGKEQPFYMLQPGEPKDGQPNATELATQYTKAILEQFPDGPYRLGGYSVGGLMAYETAKQLTAQGHTVDLLLLIGAPRSYSPMTRHLNIRLRALALKYLPAPERISSNTLRIIHGLFRDKGLQSHLETLVGYHPCGYKGKIDYFQGKWALSRFVGTHRNWMKNAEGAFELHLLPGNHDSFMREPHLGSLARRLSHCIRVIARKESGTR